LLSFPAAFTAGDLRLPALCSGSFFVEPQARGTGFLMFRRYLNSAGYAFLFSTTCNANSRAIWEKLGSRSIPGSDTEYILPLRMDAALPSVVSRKTSNSLALGVARALGHGINPLVRSLLRRSKKFDFESSRDWEKLSELFRRHKSPSLITTDRSVQYLKWRYGPDSPNFASDICVFRDRLGNEGWFTLGYMTRGQQGQVRTCVLLDAVWPREKMGFGDVLPAILQRIAPKADAIFLRERPGIRYREYSRWIFARKLGGHQGWVARPKNGQAVDVGCMDVVNADGDTAWTYALHNDPFPAD
jgi:hypothetical protein